MIDISGRVAAAEHHLTSHMLSDPLSSPGSLFLCSRLLKIYSPESACEQKLFPRMIKKSISFTYIVFPVNEWNGGRVDEEVWYNIPCNLVIHPVKRPFPAAGASPPLTKPGIKRLTPNLIPIVIKE